MSEPRVIRYNSDGKTDIGVLPKLIEQLLDDPSNIQWDWRRFDSLQGRSLAQKVLFFKRQAQIDQCIAAVFVTDTEGEKKRLPEITHGRDMGHPELPMSVGVAHPCIEAWLLVDASAIRRGLNLQQRPTNLPYDPESLPAPNVTAKLNKTDPKKKSDPKSVLALLSDPPETINAAQKAMIAEHTDVTILESKCPSFQAFATEVKTHIATLFHIPTVENTAVEETL